MNIFWVHSDPILAAQALCDKHVVKMPTETAQMLCTLCRKGGVIAPYRKTHENNPCVLWAGESEANRQWLLLHGKALCGEYTKRYGRVHAAEKVIHWCRLHAPKAPIGPLTSPPLVMPDKYRQQDPVEAYRAFYREAKRPFARWAKGTPTPPWFDL